MSLKKCIGAIAKADRDFHMIENNDCICVGVSGGKDSSLLLYALSLYRKTALRYYNKTFDVIGVHLDMGFETISDIKLQDFFQEKGIAYYHYPTKIYDILKLHPTNHDTISCALCSKLKKGAIVQAAKAYHCNKTAFAHHGDDAIETLVLNMLYGGRINTFEPKMYLENSNMDFIRPFVYLFEDQIENACKNENIPILQSGCPNDGYTKRTEVKTMLQKLYKQYPFAKHNLLKSLYNQQQVKLWMKEDEK